METVKISWRSFFRTVFTIALPIAFQNFLSTTASMVDTIMIGSQGELSVAAVGICSQITSLFFSCYFGFATVGMLFFSQYWGARNEKGISQSDVYACGFAAVWADGGHKPGIYAADLYG